MVSECAWIFLATAGRVRGGEGIMGSRLLIRGRHRAGGRVRISGAKNSAVAILPACLLAQDVCSLEGIPDIGDVRVMLEILSGMGVKHQRIADRVEVDPTDPGPLSIPYALAKRVRASILFLGPLLARWGRARVPLPGGCNIGSRPVDLHLKGLQELGAQVTIEHGHVVAEARRLKGTEIYLDFPSVGATENLMMAACRAQGTTIIYNAAKEPEVVDLANFLNALGGRVVGAGTDVVRIDGRPGLGGTSYAIIPDRIEAGTYLLAGLVGGGEIRLDNVIPAHLQSLLTKLEECGVEWEERDDSIIAALQGPPRALQVKTLPYPGFPTDLQPQLSAFLLLARGTSVITERIFEDRFGHVDELKRLGGQIAIEGRSAVIRGVSRLTGALVTATDLRMGAALVVAAAGAEGETVIEGVEHIDRGYEKIEEKLLQAGILSQRVDLEEVPSRS